jgi:hypothetical protein
MSDKITLLKKIHENGLRAIKISINSLIENPNRPHNTAALDCVLGSRLTTLALKQLGDDLPAEIKKWFFNQQIDELKHCHSMPNKEYNIMAEKIGAYHEKVLREDGWVSFLVTMPLTGERMSLGTAFQGRFSDDPHTIPEYFVDEVNHITWPLILLALYATDEQLEKALIRQEEFIKIVEGAYFAGKN